MLIDRNEGEWNIKSTLLDDYAYQLYLNNKISNCRKHAQSTFIHNYKILNRFKSFYKKAHDIIIKEKLNNINNGINL